MPIMDLSRFPTITPQSGREGAQRILLERSLYEWFTQHFGNDRPCYLLIAKAIWAVLEIEVMPKDVGVRIRNWQKA